MVIENWLLQTEALSAREAAESPTAVKRQPYDLTVHKRFATFACHARQRANRLVRPCLRIDAAVALLSV